MSPWEPQAGGNGGSQTPLAQEFVSAKGHDNQLPVFTKNPAGPILVPGPDTLETMQWLSMARIDDKVPGAPHPFAGLYSTDHGNSYNATAAVGVNALNSTVVNVGSTVGFPAAAGSFWLQGVNVAYTGVAGGNSFTGCGNHPATVGGEGVTLYGGGRLGLVYADDPMGPLIPVVGAGPAGCVYQDNDGTETETPTIIWNDETALWHVYHHQVGAVGEVGSGVTKLLTTPDFVNYTEVGIVLDLPDGSHFFSPFATYMKPFRIGRKWIATFLLTGGSWPRYGFAYSHDGIHWVLDPRYLGYNAEWLSDPNTERISMVNASYFEWNGRMLCVTARTTHTSGYADRVSPFVIGAVSPDLRNFVGPPTDIPCFLTEQSWETRFYDGISLLLENNVLYLYYRSNQPVVFGGAGEGFAVASAPLGVAA